ncbi:MAG TPA: MBL fold metallo-hydrolase [Anaerolineales bacterium]|nr:MBL fold metallo-hydrolase [Anaerolineales bacterium]
MLQIIKLPLGPIQTNCYLLADAEIKICVVVDPSGSAQSIEKVIRKEGWHLQAIWLTHAHWDHFLGLVALLEKYPETPVALHVLDLPLYQAGGGARWWNIPIELGPAPRIALEQVRTLQVGAHSAQVLFVPGHAPGHVAFYFAHAQALIGGDVLFAGSIGRTDLPSANHAQLLASIRAQFLTLPDATIVYPGHGENTTIGTERVSNPHLLDASW